MQNKRILIIIGSSFVAFLLFSIIAYLLYRRYTREVENSNWSKEGEWVVFQCTPVGVAPKSSLYLIRPDGSEIIRLTTGKQSATSPSWSPDGEEIVFEYSNKIFKLERGARKLTPLVDQPYRLEEFPAWSPDGKWIAFVSSPLEGAATLFRVSADGSILEPVIGGVERDSITWSPDGEWIVYSAYGKARRIRVDGGEVQEYMEDESEKKQLTNLPAGAIYPIWSPDGEWIVFTSGIHNHQLFTVKVDGSELQQITDLECDALSSDWIRMSGSE